MRSELLVTVVKSLPAEIAILSIHHIGKLGTVVTARVVTVRDSTIEIDIEPDSRVPTRVADVDRVVLDAS